MSPSMIKSQFQNYPDAVAAVDSTTIPFYIPPNDEEKRKTYDFKNAVNGHKLQAAVTPDGLAIHTFSNRGRIKMLPKIGKLSKDILEDLNRCGLQWLVDIEEIERKLS